ncbi:MAG TPA: hypothetical protein VJB90_00900 [Candidatus Nanoarchaeia archaeon]|nr:hypothetical protein [Candidatus Nanoarchaeia archaeon]
MAIDDIVDRDDPRLDDFGMPVNHVFGMKASMMQISLRAIDNNRYREELAEFAEQYEYTGSNPTIMFALYDSMPQDSGQGFLYGIRAWERSTKAPELLMQLQNPDRLVAYIINNIDDIDELLKIQETIAFEGRFYSRVTGLFGDRADNKNFANSLLMVASEIAMRIGEVTLDDDLVNKPREEVDDIVRKLNIRDNALAHRVLAYQVASGISEETFGAIGVYEKATGIYEAPGFDIGVMEAYFKAKHGFDKPRTDQEIPEELKADENWNAGAMMGARFSYDQYFRERYFGTKEPEWRRSQRQRQESRRTADGLVDDLMKMIEDPWGYFAPELEVLGVNKEMNYEEARAAYRRVMKDNRAVFGIREQFPGTDSQWEAAMELVKRANIAWEKVGFLYREKDISPAA